MPELPEVETLRAALARAIPGATLKHIEILDAKIDSPTAPQSLPLSALKNATATSFDRLGKWLVIRLHNKFDLVIHLRMTGKILLLDPSTSERKHWRALIPLASSNKSPKTALVFHDVRRFGTIDLVPNPAESHHPGLAACGPDALAAPVSAWNAVCKGTAPIKSALLDQRRIAGIGNIYADEALFLARIHPLQPAGTLGPAHHKALKKATDTVLRAAIRAGGTTIRDYASLDGERGWFARKLHVYGRAAELCAESGELIERIVVGGRSTYYSPGVQRLLP